MALFSAFSAAFVMPSRIDPDVAFVKVKGSSWSKKDSFRFSVYCSRYLYIECGDGGKVGSGKVESVLLLDVHLNHTKLIF